MIQLIFVSAVVAVLTGFPLYVLDLYDDAEILPGAELPLGRIFPFPSPRDFIVDFGGFVAVLFGLTTPAWAFGPLCIVYTALIDRLSPVQPRDLPDGLKQDEAWRRADNPLLYIKHAKQELFDLEAKLFDIYVEDLRLQNAQRRPDVYWKFGHRVTRRLLERYFPGNAVEARRRAETLRTQLTAFFNGNPKEIVHELRDQLDAVNRQLQKERSRGRLFRVLRRIYDSPAVLLRVPDEHPSLEALEHERSKLQQYLNEVTTAAAAAAPAASMGAGESPVDPIWAAFTQKERDKARGKYHKKAFEVDALFEAQELRAEREQRAKEWLREGKLPRAAYEAMMREIERQFAHDVESDAGFKRR